MLCIFILFLSAALNLGEGFTGVDLSVLVNASTWDCVLKETNATFASVRLYRNIGQTDANAPSSIKVISAKTPVDGYIFPCISSSTYSVAHDIKCPDGKQQVVDTIQYLESQDISIEGSSGRQTNAKISRIWLDIEDEAPSKYYDSDATVNQALVATIVEELVSRNISVGIYTTKTYWTNIMASNPNYGQFPLWYPRYDGVDSFDFFVPFSGWEKLAIKQTAGDAPICGISQIDLDYFE